MLGAIDFVSKKVTTVTNDTYITDTEVCVMLKKPAEEYAGKKIHVVLDNAKYQKCALVKNLAEELKIDLVYLPPYSPNLNLIERLWKFVKSKLCIKYYSDFLLFKKAIDSIIDDVSEGSKEELSKLIGEKIQLFDSLNPISENTYVLNKMHEKQVA